MDTPRKRTPDYTDIAYREAVARLRYLLAESYSPHSSPTKITHIRSAKADDSGDETDASIAMSERSRSLRHHHPLPPLFRSTYYGTKRPLYTDVIPKSTQPASTLQVPKVVENAGAITMGSKTENQPPPPELMAFIERQEDYIEQLEKESQFCREELSNLLSKVKDVISENEGLHEKEKSGLFKSVCEYLTSGGEEEEEEDDDQDEKRDKKKSPIKKKRLEGPSIVFESRISELEAQLTQTRIELRKAQEETDLLKRKYEGNEPVSFDVNLGLGVDQFRKQIETLQREKEELAENVTKLNSAISHMQEKEAKASQKIKRSVDLVDQAQFEKTQAELEVRRLKDELERQHEKLRDLLQEQGRRVQDERSQAERRYAQQVEQLTCDLSTQWDTAGKLQLELEKQRRTENELRRELQQKCTTIEELKKELQTKIASLQTEATQSAAERGSLEQELAAGRLAAERAEREARQEAARLQAEITALRQRLDRADSDVLHSRRENLRLSEQIASLERELNLAKMMRDTEDKPGMSSPGKSREKELTSMIMNMEAKHVQTVGELESMIQSQTDLMEKLKDECRSLTQKLEESSARHKEEMAGLQSNVGYLSSKLDAFEAQDWRDNTYVEGNEQGPEHGFALDEQFEQQSQFIQGAQLADEPQHGDEVQQPITYPEQEYGSQSTYPPQSEYEQPSEQYAPQSTYESQSNYRQHEQEYAAHDPHQPQQEYEQEYDQQSNYGPQAEYETAAPYEPQSNVDLQPSFGTDFVEREQPSDYEHQFNFEQQSSGFAPPQYSAQEDQFQPSQTEYQSPQHYSQPIQGGEPDGYSNISKPSTTLRKQYSGDKVPPSPRRSRSVSRQGSGSDQMPPISPSRAPQSVQLFRQGSSELPPRSPSRAAFASRKQSSTDRQSPTYGSNPNYRTESNYENMQPYANTYQGDGGQQPQYSSADTYSQPMQPQLSRQPSAESRPYSRAPSVERQ